MPTALSGVDLPRLKRIAAVVASQLRAGDVVMLSGKLAAGKTQFVKCLADALQIDDPVTSPTFTLAHFYAGPGVGLLHVDAYRIETKAELDDLTLEDFLDGYALVIEWGEKFKDALPPAMAIEIAAEPDDRRTVTIDLSAATWADRKTPLQAALEAVPECP